MAGSPGPFKRPHELADEIRAYTPGSTTQYFSNPSIPSTISDPSPISQRWKLLIPLRNDVYNAASAAYTIQEIMNESPELAAPFRLVVNPGKVDSLTMTLEDSMKRRSDIVRQQMEIEIDLHQAGPYAKPHKMWKRLLLVVWSKLIHKGIQFSPLINHDSRHESIVFRTHSEKITGIPSTGRPEFLPSPFAFTAKLAESKVAHGDLMTPIAMAHTNPFAQLNITFDDLLEYHIKPSVVTEFLRTAESHERRRQTAFIAALEAQTIPHDALSAFDTAEDAIMTESIAAFATSRSTEDAIASIRQNPLIASMLASWHRKQEKCLTPCIEPDDLATALREAHIDITSETKEEQVRRCVAEFTNRQRSKDITDYVKSSYDIILEIEKELPLHHEGRRTPGAEREAPKTVTDICHWLRSEAAYIAHFNAHPAVTVLHTRQLAFYRMSCNFLHLMNRDLLTKCAVDYAMCSVARSAHSHWTSCAKKIAIFEALRDRFNAAYESPDNKGDLTKVHRALGAIAFRSFAENHVLLNHQRHPTFHKGKTSSAIIEEQVKISLS